VSLTPSYEALAQVTPQLDQDRTPLLDQDRTPLLDRPPATPLFGQAPLHEHQQDQLLVPLAPHQEPDDFEATDETPVGVIRIKEKVEAKKKQGKRENIPAPKIGNVHRIVDGQLMVDWVKLAVSINLYTLPNQKNT